MSSTVRLITSVDGGLECSFVVAFIIVSDFLFRLCLQITKIFFMENRKCTPREFLDRDFNW